MKGVLNPLPIKSLWNRNDYLFNTYAEKNSQNVIPFPSTTTQFENVAEQTNGGLPTK